MSKNPIAYLVIESRGFSYLVSKLFDSLIKGKSTQITARPNKQYVKGNNALDTTVFYVAIVGIDEDARDSTFVAYLSKDKDGKNAKLVRIVVPEDDVATFVVY